MSGIFSKRVRRLHLILSLRGGSKSSASSDEGIKEVLLLSLTMSILKGSENLYSQGRHGLHKRRSVATTASNDQKRVLRQLKVPFRNIFSVIFPWPVCFDSKRSPEASAADISPRYPSKI